MSASELKYLIAVNALCGGDGVKLTAIAEKAGVSKASVYKALERLSYIGYVIRDDKFGILLTESGRTALAEYTDCIRCMQSALERYCNVPRTLAYNDALKASCAISDAARRAVLSFLRERDA